MTHVCDTVGKHAQLAQQLVHPGLVARGRLGQRVVGSRHRLGQPAQGKEQADPGVADVAQRVPRSRQALAEEGVQRGAVAGGE